MRERRKYILVIVIAWLAALAAAAPAFAGTVTGTVRNGTTGKPAAGVDVILIQLQGGMEPVANTKTDARGAYKIDNPGVGGQQPMLIRAVYRGVMFHQPLTPGSTTADVTVFDPSTDAKTVEVDSRAIIFQPDGAKLLVTEQYALKNQSQPPVAYFNQQGNFDFGIPEGAQNLQVSSWGPSGMPVVQGTMDRGNRRYAIAYAFQPGDNGVRLSYELPYDANQAKLHFTSENSVQGLLLAAPPPVQVASEGFTAAGNEQGFNLYSRSAVPQGAEFDVSISGTAPPPPDGQQAGQQDGQQDAQQAQGQGAQDQVNSRDPGPAVQALPNRLDSLRWVLIAGIAGLFALGAVFVWRRPVALAPGAAVAAVPAAPSVSQGARKQAARVQDNPKPPPATPAAPPPAPSAVAQEVERSLDGLKDRLFRLELRHQAGTISEEDYAREHGRIEQLLRELVRG